jgi:ABC-2 type transport system permease protein
VAGIRNFCFLHQVLVNILVPNQLKATEILMVIATALFKWIYLAFKSNASLGSGHFIPLTHSESFFQVLIVKTERFPKPLLFGHGYYWTICGILSYMAFLNFKRKMYSKRKTSSSL